MFLPLERQLDVGRLERAISLTLTRQRRAARRGQPQLLDPLTGLLGRHAFLDRLEHALARTRRRGCSAAMLLLDIDGFQRINREFGMAAGDSLLRLVAGRLRRQLRASDTAARLGADRFGVVLEDLARPDHGGCVAQKLIAALETPAAIPNSRLIRWKPSMSSSTMAAELPRRRVLASACSSRSRKA